MRASYLGLGCTAAIAAVVSVAVIHPFESGDAALAADACPPGYDWVDPAAFAREFNPGLSDAAAQRLHDRFGEQTCANRRLPESLTEIDQWSQAKLQASGHPGQAFRKAVEQKAALLTQQKAVPNAQGEWEEYGIGPQVSDEQFPDGSNDGIPVVAGRVDDFAYDPEAMRLFASVGTGGVWASDAVDGDVGTLGDAWYPIGDNLPTLVNSSLTWTTAQGGRLIVLTGEHVQGGNTYVGLGALYTDDLGETWQQSVGLPDGVGGSRITVDPSNPNIIYAGTHGGLFRSDDAGATFTNVALPVSPECAGNEDFTGPCQLANVVTDVVVKIPGGATEETCDPAGCPVLAAVGYRSGNLPYADGTPQSPGNGLYLSQTGEAGSFARIDDGSGAPAGFAPFEKIGRVEFGIASGEDQDHNIVYAIVQDAALLNGGVAYIDSLIGGGIEVPDLPCEQLPAGDPQFVCELVEDTGALSSTALNGIYVSTDFGESWTQLADELEILTSGLVGGSSLAAAAALGVGPGIQAWYDLWIAPDPTATDPLTGAPTRLTFGLEEIWQTESSGIVPINGITQQLNPLDFGVVGTYFAGNTCLFLIGNVGGVGTPICPTYDGIINGTTTHPDQHVGFYIPDEVNGGVWLFAGGDGGVYKQYSADPITQPFSNARWEDGANEGFYTLMNYGISVAKDGTVYYGLQDNASGKIEPDTRRQVRIYIGDGMWTAVDPDDSQTAFVQTPGLSINRTNDGGETFSFADPGEAEVGTAHFLGPFFMDPQNADHMIAAGTMVAETTDATTETNWVNVFDLGVSPVTGLPYQSRHRSLDLEGDAAYVAYCGSCSVLDGNAQFDSGIATNVGGDLPPQAGTSDGWHHATAAGLPNRFIYGLEIDPEDPQTVYAALGGYSTARWLGEGGYLDENTNIGAGHVFKSTDAGESFVDISGNLPDVVTTAIIKRGEQLIVGTDIGVFISSDLDGTEWAPLGDLPNVPINQLVLQPGDDSKLFAATFGRGVQLFNFDNATTPPVTPGPSTPGTGTGAGGAVLPLGLLMMLAGGLWRRRRPQHHLV